jgi:hypothetical protein
MLNKKIAKHDSLRLSAKVVGPRVPKANLRKKPNLVTRPVDTSETREERTHGTIVVFAESHKKNILTKCVSVLSSSSTGWMPNQRTNRSQKDDQISQEKRESHPAIPHPKSRAFARHDESSARQKEKAGFLVP